MIVARTAISIVFAFSLLSSNFFHPRQVEVLSLLVLGLAIGDSIDVIRRNILIISAFAAISLLFVLLYKSGFYQNVSYSIEGALIFPRSILMFVVLMVIGDRFFGFSNFLRIYIFVSAAIVLISFLEYGSSVIFNYISITFPDEDGRLYGFSSNPNYFGFMLILPFSVLLFSQTIFSCAVSRLGALVFTFFGLFATQSRGVWAAMVFLMIVYWVCAFWRSRRSAPSSADRGHGFVVLVCCLVAGLVLVLSPSYNQRATGLVPTVASSGLDNSQGDNVERVEGGAGRYALWISAVHKFVSSEPLRQLFGHGIGSFPHVVPNEKGYWAHNSYITSIIDTGIVGLAFVVSVVAYFLFINAGGWGASGRGVPLGVLAVLITSGANDFFYTPHFWFLIAFLAPRGLAKIAVDGRQARVSGRS